MTTVTPEPGLRATQRARRVRRLVELGIDILFVIGGDGSMRGAATLVDVITRRRLSIGVIGVPKTIDNDIPFIGTFRSSARASASSPPSAGRPSRSA